MRKGGREWERRKGEGEGEGEGERGKEYWLDYTK